MTQFEKLQEKVEAAVSALPYALNEEQNKRLENELRAINEYRRAGMLNAAAEIVSEFSDEQGLPELSNDEGYCVSFVCWLLGISDFNPFMHPGLVSEKYAVNTFRERNEISMFYDEENNWQSVIYRLYGDRAKCKYSSCMQIEDSAEEGQSFKIEVSFYRQSHIYNVERAIRENSDLNFSSLDIPFDDEKTFRLIQSNDWLGLLGKTGVSLKFIEAMRLIHPATFNELVHALAIYTSSILDIELYVYNRDNGIAEYTGVAAVDDILHQSNGILLYTRQENAIKKIMKTLSAEEVRKVKPVVANKITEPKCCAYTEAVDVYRRAYMKAHYPEIFRQVIIAADDEI